MGGRSKQNFPRNWQPWLWTTENVEFCDLGECFWQEEVGFESEGTRGADGGRSGDRCDFEYSLQMVWPVGVRDMGEDLDWAGEVEDVCSFEEEEGDFVSFLVICWTWCFVNWLAWSHLDGTRCVLSRTEQAW